MLPGLWSTGNGSIGTANIPRLTAKKLCRKHARQEKQSQNRIAKLNQPSKFPSPEKRNGRRIFFCQNYVHSSKISHKRCKDFLGLIVACVPSYAHNVLKSSGADNLKKSVAALYKYYDLTVKYRAED